MEKENKESIDTQTKTDDFVENEEKSDIKKDIDDKSVNDKSVEIGSDEDSKVSNNDSDCEPEFKVRLLENKLKEQEEAYLRINAEYTNYRRRTAEEKNSIGLFANEKIMLELIPVIDNMERALDSFENKEDSLYKGVDLVYKQMLDALKKSGLELIDSNEGIDFDPNFHMAVLQEESKDYEPGKIIMTMQKGYKLDKKVLRPSMVKVSS